MNAVVEGKVYFKSELETIGANAIKKQILVIETEEQHPQKIPVEFIKDKTDLLTGKEVGDSVTVRVNVKGNEYQDRNQVTRFGLTFQGWKFD